MFPIRIAQCEKSYATRLQRFRRPHAGVRSVFNGHLCRDRWLSNRELVYLLRPMYGIGHGRKGPGNSWSDVVTDECTRATPHKSRSRKLLEGMAKVYRSMDQRECRSHV